MKTQNIQLGDTVQSIISGFTGVAVSETKYINGCIQIEVQPKVDKDNKIQECVSIDIENLKVIKKGLRHKELEEKLGGATHITRKQRGC